MALFTPSHRDETVARVLELLDNDPRIEAAVITGSIGADRADRWSDLDLAAVVADEADCEQVTALDVLLAARDSTST